MTGSDSAGPTVFLHIGTPKSGTTFIQSSMAANHEQAKEQGLLWPGPGWGAHVRAARNLRQLGEGRSLKKKGPWPRLARQAREWPGSSVLISMEWLASCSPHQIRAAVDSLQPCRVEVICTARDLGRTFISQWQQMTKNHRPWTWRQFVEQMVEHGSGEAHTNFWDQQDLPAILSRWLEVVPSDRVHLVTVPPQGSDPNLLWQRFCSVVDIDGASFEPPARRNESLGVVSTVLMQRVNVAATDQGVRAQEYKQVVRRVLAKEVLASRRGVESPIAFSADVDAWVRRRADRLIEDVSAFDVNIVGSLDDLSPGAPPAGRDPNEVTDGELLSTCVEALLSLGVSQFRALDQLEADNKKLRRRLEKLQKQKQRQKQKRARGGQPAKRLGSRGRRAAASLRSRGPRPAKPRGE